MINSYVILSHPDTFFIRNQIVPTDAEALDTARSPVTPLPPLLGIDGTPSAKPTFPLPLRDNATTLLVASHSISVVELTDHATPVIVVRGSVAAPAAAEASNIAVELLVPVVVIFTKYSKSLSTISCNTTVSYTHLTLPTTVIV